MLNKDAKIIIYNLKVEKQLRDRFLAIAKHLESDGAKEVRKFMKKYVSDNANLALHIE